MTLARVFVLCLIFIAPQFAIAGDWPQILGPNRNGIAQDEKLASTWPKSGPVIVWNHPVAKGLAGVAVAKGKVFIFDRTGGNERLVARDALTGDQRWESKWRSDYEDQIAGDNGPRCVPLVHSDRVYAYGAAGTLACREVKDGSEVWTRNLAADYQADLGYFGAGSTPVIDDKVLIVNVGGMKSRAGVVGLSIDTGKEIWKSVADSASYSSPIVVTVEGVRHLLCITRLKFLSLDPQTGKVQFEFPFGQRGPTVNGATPVFFKNHVLLTSSYGIGATLAQIHTNSADQKWTGDEILSSQYTTPIVKDSFVYGIDGRQDQGSANLKCFDPLTRKVKWSEDDFGMATLILADDKLICMKTDGTLVLAAVSPQSYEQLATTSLFNATCRPLPALANGRLYVRDTGTLKCVDLSASK